MAVCRIWSLSIRAMSSGHMNWNSKYFEFQFIWPELMARMDSDQILHTAIVQSVARRQAAANMAAAFPVAGAGAGVDPGVTSEIRLNIAE